MRRALPFVLQRLYFYEDILRPPRRQAKPVDPSMLRLRARSGPWYDRSMPCDPLSDLRAWQERLERLAHPQAEPWTPPIDVYETPAAYVITVEVPGLTREQVELAVEDTRLILRGRRLEVQRQTGGPVHYHLIERGYGAFARSFEFAEKVDVNGVNADLAEGVLTITLPKVPPPAARRIEVR